MERGGIFVRARELNRHQVIQRCLLGKLSNSEAALLLGISHRQVQRLKRRVENADLLGVMHGNRGREPVNKISSESLAVIRRQLCGPWEGLNVLHARDKLAEECGIKIGRETLRQLYNRFGLSVRKHRVRRRFNRRERKPMEGMLLQMDGSFHDWFGTGEKCTLIAAIDDATNEVPWACFVDYETSLNYLGVLRRVVEIKGVFCALYVDRHSCFKTQRRDWTNAKTFRRENFDETQVMRALSELGIEMINANTPQAKGRVERLFQTLQDRLLKELRMKGITTKEEANRFLHEGWLDYFNRKFTKEPAQVESAYRVVPSDVDLKNVFCVKFDRRVQNDPTIRYKGILHKILEDPYRASYAKSTVQVRVYPDFSLNVFYQGRQINTQPISS